MRVSAVIPARYASTRFPGKLLARRSGKFLIQHVHERVCAAGRIDEVLIAADDQRIADACRQFGADCRMTSPDHQSGTDRIAEVAVALDCDIIVNVQGDEPEIPPRCIDTLAQLLENSGESMATLAAPLTAAAAGDPDKVKVVLTRAGLAMYFSRARIPHDRYAPGRAQYLLHLGIYAYRVAFLKQFAAMAPTPAEQAEKLEQLRALENGYSIAVTVVEYNGCGIDNIEDYADFVNRINGGRSQQAL